MRRPWAALLLVALLLWLILPAAPVVLAWQPPPGIARESTIRLLVADTDDAIAAIQRLGEEIFFPPCTPRLRVIKIYFFPYGLLTTGKYTFSNPSVVNDQKALALA